MSVDNFIKEVEAFYGIQVLGDIVVEGARRRARTSDKPHKRNLVYKLQYDEAGLLYGWYFLYHFQSEKSVNTYSEKATGKRLSKEELEAHRKAKDERDKAEKARKKAALAAAEKEANEIWTSADKQGHSEYLLKKNLSVDDTCRVKNGTLIVPLYKEKKIVNVQRILSSGAKYFLTGGEVTGAYCVLFDKDDDKSHIIVTEGYATGRKIRIATGIPVFIAFNAGNLFPVAESIRKAFPDAEIVFCADNDQFKFDNHLRRVYLPDINSDQVSGDDPRWKEWREKGLLKNTGIEAANVALKKVGGRGRTCYPMFSDQHLSRKPTDFDDLATLQGIDEVRRQIIGDRSLIDFHQKEAVKEEEKVDWRKLTIYKDRAETMIAKGYNNLAVALKYREGFKDLFAYDEFSHKEIIVKCPAWQELTEFTPHEVTEVDESQLMAALERAGYSVSVEGLQRAITEAAHQNKVHPARDYFKSLKWDNVPRLHEWLKLCAGCTVEPEEYVSAVGLKFVTAMVSRVLWPGCQQDHMLILEGPQGLGKSRLLRKLVTINGVSYLLESITLDQLGSKDAISSTLGKLLVEFPELSGVEKTTVRKTKANITIREDECRLPYKRRTQVFKRQFLYAASDNPIPGIGWMEDVTGNRRFWPVTATKIDLKWLDIKNEAGSTMQEQIFAEATHLALAGHECYLPKELEEVADRVREVRMKRDAWHDDIERKYQNHSHVLVDDVFDYLQIPKERRNEWNTRRIGHILTRLGRKGISTSHEGKKGYYWVKK